tara:strand:+ start:11607 stop:12170 length:564 start_codon:yes stop_codon:yes gene_type:complete
MAKKFKKPNLNAPRFREKRLSLLNKNVLNEFKEKYPKYSGIHNDKLKKIIKLYNKNLWEGVIENRDGVQLPDSLGYLFIGTCSPAKYKNNIDYARSSEQGKIFHNNNWDTDGNIGKIFYTNASVKYKFKNRELWKFEACREFKRSVASEYPKDWTKYAVIQNKYQIAHLYQNKVDKSALKDYNEFEL